MAFMHITSAHTPIEIVRYNNGLEDIVSLRISNHIASLVMTVSEAEQLVSQLQTALEKPLRAAA